MASDTLYECFLLIEACIATIHAYVLTHRWDYETENARSLHVLVWRLQLIFSVCVPTIVFIAWRLFYQRRRQQRRQQQQWEETTVAAVDENKNLDLSVCTALFCLAMLCLGKESRRGTADADIDDIVMICCLGIIGLVGIILFVWTDHRRTTTTTTTTTTTERPTNILLRLFCRRRCHRFYNDDDDDEDGGGTRLVFLEGTSCLGKTSLVSPHRSFDMMEYLRREPMYRQKHRLAYWQALYDMELYADLMLFRLTTILARGNAAGGGGQQIFADRSHVSQFCYAIVFAYDGAHSEPHIFAERVDREIFNDPSISMALQRAASSWRKIDERINELATTATTKPLSSTILWCVSAEPKRTAESLLRRANPYELNMLFGGGRAAVASDIARTPEEQRRRVLLTERYVRNQNHVFTRVSRLLQDPLIEVAAATASSSSFPPLITLDSIERALLPKIRPTTITTTTTTTTEENAAAAATTTTTQDDDDDDDDDDDKTNKASAVTITTAATIEKIPPLR